MLCHSNFLAVTLSVIIKKVKMDQRKANKYFWFGLFVCIISFSLHKIFRLCRAVFVNQVPLESVWIVRSGNYEFD